MKRQQLALVGLALAVALALRLWGLTAGAFQLDEGYTVVLASASVQDIFRLIPTDPNPPLSSLVFKAWTRLFGTSEAAWESLSVVLGVLGIAYMAWMAGRLFGARAGVASAWLGAFSPLHVYYSQEVRGYALVMLLSLIAADALLRDLATPSRSQAAIFALAASLTGATHYYGLLVIAALLAGAGLAGVGQPRIWARIALLGGLFTLLSLPTLFCLYLQYTVFYGFYWIPKPAAVVVENAVYRLAGGNLILVVLCLLALAAAGWRAGRERRRRMPFLVLLTWLALPPVAAVAGSVLGKAFFHSRYVVVCLPPLILMTAFGLTQLTDRRWRTAAVVAVCLLCLPQLRKQHRNMVRTAVEQEAYERMEREFRPGDLIVHVTKESFVPALYYHRRKLPERFLEGAPTSNVMKYWLPHPTEQTVSGLAEARRIWVYRKPTEPPETAYRLFRDPRFRALGARLLRRDKLGSLLLLEIPPGAGPSGLRAPGPLQGPRTLGGDQPRPAARRFERSPSTRRSRDLAIASKVTPMRSAIIAAREVSATPGTNW